MKYVLCILLILLNATISIADGSPYMYQLSNISSSRASSIEKEQGNYTTYLHNIPQNSAKQRQREDYVYEIPDLSDKHRRNQAATQASAKRGWATKLAEKSERSTFLKTPSLMQWTMRKNVRVRSEKGLYGVQNSDQGSYKLYRVRTNAINEALRKGSTKRGHNLLGRKEQLFGKGHNISGFRR